jgi:aminoglycoside phosphotransferase (APT) family kinase protein
MTPDEVSHLILDLFGQDPLRVERMGYGHCNVVYDVTMPDETGLIVRTNRRDPSVLLGTERNLETLRRLGLPVPTVLASDPTLSRHPAAYMVLARIPGRDLGFELQNMDRAQMTRLAEQIVGFQRAAATLPRGEGFGWVAIGQPGPFPSWPAVIERDLRRHLEAAGPLLPPGVEARLRALYQPFADDLARVEPNPYLDDLTTKNVLIEDGRLRGVVDFDWICYGDPRHWLGLTQMAVVSQAPPEAEHYVDELCRLWGVSAHDRRLIALYSATFALDFLGWWRSRAPAEQLVRLLECLDRFLQEAEGSR